WQSADHRRPLSRGRGESGSLRLLGSAWPRRDPGVTLYRAEVAVFTIAFLVFGLVALALVWSGDWAYATLASVTGNTSATFVVPPESRQACGQAIVMDLARLREMHRAWVAYVVGASDVAFGPACSLFTSDERSHMADVRSVFHSAEV